MEAQNNQYKPGLSIGIHLVTITKIVLGKTLTSKFPYFKCKFENEQGWFFQKFVLYPKEGSTKFIKKLFLAAGAYTDTINPSDLLGKELAIYIKLGNVIDFLTGEIIGSKEVCVYFESVGEYECSLIRSSRIAI